jgi:hypothetical protein
VGLVGRVTDDDLEPTHTAPRGRIQAVW